MSLLVRFNLRLHLGRWLVTLPYVYTQTDGYSGYNLFTVRLTIGGVLATQVTLGLHLG